MIGREMTVAEVVEAVVKDRIFYEDSGGGVTISGGEPLIRQDLSELTRHGKDAGIIEFGLVTNGHFADAARVRELCEAGLDTVQVSLDGVDATDHSAARGCGPGEFYRGVRAVNLFKSCGVAVYVATILNPRNVQRAPEMAMFCPPCKGNA